MPLEMELDVKGIIKSFKKAEARLAENIPVALKLSGDIVAAEARRFHDYKDRDGTLTRSIMSDEVRGSFEQGDLEVIVSAGAPYALFVEEGTDDHPVTPKHRKALRWPIEGGFAFSKGHKVSGIDATHFLANASLSAEPQMEQVVEDAAALSFLQAGFEVE